MKNIFKKVETEEEFVIRWADSLISNSTYNGEMKRDSFTLDWVFSTNPPTPQEIKDWDNNESKKIRDEAIKKLGNNKDNLTILVNELSRYEDAVKNHFLKEGYIDEPKFMDKFWVLNSNGKLVKDLSGHKKYNTHKKRELAATVSDQNSKRYYIPIIIALLAITLSSTISLVTYFSNKNKIEKIEIHQLKLDSIVEIQTKIFKSLKPNIDTILNNPKNKQP